MVKLQINDAMTISRKKQYGKENVSFVEFTALLICERSTMTTFYFLNKFTMFCTKIQISQKIKPFHQSLPGKNVKKYVMENK